MSDYEPDKLAASLIFEDRGEPIPLMEPMLVRDKN